MHDQASASDVIGQLDQAREHVLEKCGAETTPLVCGVDPEPGEQRDRLRVTARASSGTFNNAAVNATKTFTNDAGKHVLCSTNCRIEVSDNVGPHTGSHPISFPK